MPLPRYFEKLAHKHWSHFNQQQNFFDHKERKRLYAPFKKEQPNEEISKLFEQYKKIKQTKIDELTKEWEAYIHETWLSKELADFTKSGANALYDLRNKQQHENF